MSSILTQTLIQRITGIVILLLVLSCSGNSDSITPVRRTLTERVYASGTVKTEKQYTAYSTVSGTLLKINAVAGQNVVRGHVIFQVENQKERLKSESALLSYRHSMAGGNFIRNRIKEMENTVNASAVKAGTDCSYYERCKNAMPYSGITQAELDRADAVCRTSRFALEASRKQLAQLKDLITHTGVKVTTVGIPLQTVEGVLYNNYIINGNKGQFITTTKRFVQWTLK